MTLVTILLLLLIAVEITGFINNISVQRYNRRSYGNTIKDLDVQVKRLMARNDELRLQLTLVQRDLVVATKGSEVFDGRAVIVSSTGVFPCPKNWSEEYRKTLDTIQ